MNLSTESNKLTTNFYQLPTEILIHCGSYLPLKDTLNFRLASKKTEKAAQKSYCFLIPHDHVSRLSNKDREKYEQEIINKFNIRILKKTNNANLEKIICNINSFYIEKYKCKFSNELEDFSGNILPTPLIQKEFLEYVEQKKQILVLIQTSSLSISTISNLAPNLRADSDIILACVKNWGYTLEYASKTLQSDSEIVLEAVKQNSDALRYASRNLQNNPEIVLEAVKKNGHSLRYASMELRNNPEIVLEAIKQSYFALEHASQNLRNDQDFLLKAVTVKPFALIYASEELKNNPTIVLAAIKQDPFALGLASKNLRNNLEIVLEAAKQNIGALRYASQDLRVMLLTKSSHSSFFS